MLRRVFSVACCLTVGCSLGLPSGPLPPDAGNKVLSGDGGIAGFDASAPLACPPITTGFRPTQVWHPPNPLHRNVCTETQALQLAECLAVHDSQPGACDSFKAMGGNSICVQCAITSSINATYGPIVDDGSVIYPNMAGCVSALSGDSSATSCGASVLANDECSDYACRDCSDAREYGPAYMACAERASENECLAAYDRRCAATFEPQCFGQSFKEDLLKVIKLFCGT